MLQGDSNPDPQNQLELKVHTSVPGTTWGDSDSSNVKKVHIPSLW